MNSVCPYCSTKQVHGMVSIAHAYIGEFGQVYKGYVKIKFKTDVVAVKTLKGKKV